MEQFVAAYHARGDTPVSDFLFAYLAVARMESPRIQRLVTIF
jgi:hypothetical protein